MTPEPSGQPTSRSAWDGYYHGSATVGGTAVELDALLMPDGQIRMRIGEASDDFGLIRPSLQYVGTFEQNETGIAGGGVVIGQGCARANAGVFCGKAVPAALDLKADGRFGANPSRERLAGTLRLFEESGVDTWWISTDWLDQAYAAGATSFYSGQYLAEPWTEVSSMATVLSVDALGSVFLQSPLSGCVANGIVTAGSRLEMIIAGCVGEFDYLNGDYEGLVSDFCENPWEYGCYGLSVWLSAVGSAAQTKAVTITAEWLTTEP